MFKKRNIKTTSTKRKIQIDDGDTEESLLKSTTVKKIKPTVTAQPKNVPSRETQYNVSTQELSNKNDTVMDVSKKPLKAIPVNVRTTTITDFQPDVCKDFQQTGYCGYGDTCKFLHIRGESKNNKPIVKEWEITSKSSTQQPVPFKCVLCKNDYKNAVKTNCNHLYCRDCFMDRIRKDKKTKCFICNEDTKGICSPVSGKEVEKLVQPPI